MIPNSSALGKESPGKSALTARCVVVAAGCCGYRSVRDSRSVSLSHPAGGTPLLGSPTYPTVPGNPRRPRRYRPRTLQPPPSRRAHPSLPSAGSSVVLALTFLSFREFRRSATTIFRYARLPSFFFGALFTRDLRMFLELSTCRFSFGCAHISDFEN